MISITVETMGYYENLNVTSCLKSVRDRVELALGWVGEITFKFRLRGLGRHPPSYFFCLEYIIYSVYPD